MTSSLIHPTHSGYVDNKYDEALLIEAFLSGKLAPVSRFPKEDELEDIVRSGNTYVYAEIPNGSGTWNDGPGWMHYECEGRTIVEHRKDFFKERGNMNYRGITIYFVSYHIAGEKATLSRPSPDTLLENITIKILMPY
ncbi:MAG: hypothetical protein Q9214_003451 [Letrouitia sp. 1 TL-2023]